MICCNGGGYLLLGESANIVVMSIGYLGGGSVIKGGATGGGSFRVKGEQVDGSFILSDEVYLLEACIGCNN